MIDQELIHGNVFFAYMKNAKKLLLLCGISKKVHKRLSSQQNKRFAANSLRGLPLIRGQSLTD